MKNHDESLFCFLLWLVYCSLKQTCCFSPFSPDLLLLAAKPLFVEVTLIFSRSWKQTNIFHVSFHIFVILSYQSGQDVAFCDLALVGSVFPCPYLCLENVFALIKQIPNTVMLYSVCKHWNHNRARILWWENCQCLYRQAV